MFRDDFQRVLREYLGNVDPSDPKKNFTNNPLAGFIRHDLPADFLRITPSPHHYKFKGSPGMGQWADCPWVAVMDDRITDSVRRGYYIVYLFRKDMHGVYLTLNQGMTELRDSLGHTAAINRLKSQAIKYRSLIGDSGRFQVTDIDLASERKSDRSYFYEGGSIFGKYYDVKKFPSDEEIKSDYYAMLDLYQKLIAKNNGTQ
jgi:5-methylcytosine-specific restriction protein A